MMRGAGECGEIGRRRKDARAWQLDIRITSNHVGGEIAGPCVDIEDDMCEIEPRVDPWAAPQDVSILPGERYRKAGSASGDATAASFQHGASHDTPAASTPIFWHSQLIHLEGGRCTR